MKVILLMILMSSHVFAGETRTYKTKYGEINLLSLESIISKDLNLGVKDLYIRHSYNPFDIIGSSVYKIYVVNTSTK